MANLGFAWRNFLEFFPNIFDPQLIESMDGSSHVWMWELDLKKGWTPKNWCVWTVVLEKTLESPLDCKEIKPVSSRGNQSWIVIGRTDAEAEALILGPTDSKSQLTGEDPDAGKDWRQEKKGTTEDEMVWWHHWLMGGHEFEQALGDGEGQGSLACCSPQSHKELETTEWLNHNKWMEGMQIQNADCILMMSCGC